MHRLLHSVSLLVLIGRSIVVAICFAMSSHVAQKYKELVDLDFMLFRQLVALLAPMRAVVIRRLKRLGAEIDCSTLAL